MTEFFQECLVNEQYLFPSHSHYIDLCDQFTKLTLKMTTTQVQ